MSTFNTVYLVMFTLIMVADIINAAAGGDYSQTHYILGALGAGIIALSYLFL